ncbi:hypothetical protein ABEF95_007933 [Exophiala dermatitidis]
MLDPTKSPPNRDLDQSARFQAPIVLSSNGISPYPPWEHLSTAGNSLFYLSEQHARPRMGCDSANRTGQGTR